MRAKGALYIKNQASNNKPGLLPALEALLPLYRGSSAPY